MKLRELTRKYIYEKAGIKPGGQVVLNGKLKWVPVMILPASEQADKSYFTKSVQAEVDDNGKRSHFSIMIEAIFNAMMLEDFTEFLSGTVVKYKPAHKFKYQNKFESLWELKHGKKDRIYIYPHTGPCGNYVFFIEAAHKNQTATEKSVRDHAETEIKRIIDSKVMMITKG